MERECVICLDQYDAPLSALECGHLFHDYCVWPWVIKAQKPCPLCRDGDIWIAKESDPDVIEIQTEVNTPRPPKPPEKEEEPPMTNNIEVLLENT